MGRFLLSVFCVFALSLPLSRAQCTDTDFSIAYGPGSPSFLVSQTNGSCSCPGGFVGPGSKLTGLSAQFEIAAMNASTLALIAGQAATIQAQAAQIAALQQQLLSVNSSLVVCSTTSDCPSGLVCSVNNNRCLLPSAASCQFNRQCSYPYICSGGVCGSPCTSTTVFSSCRAALGYGCTTTGYYTLDPDGPGPQQPFSAYCQQSFEGGGWAVVWSTVAGDPSEAAWSTTTLNPTANPFAAKHHLSLAQIQSLQQTEHALYRSATQWLRISAPFLATSQWPNHSHEYVTITSNGGTVTLAYLNIASINNGGGGFYSITSGGPDHHSSSYQELNSGCASSYVYNYGGNMFATNSAVGAGWPVTDSCCNTAGCTRAVVVMVR